MNPKDIKLYHILHVDRLSSVIQHGGLFSDAEQISRHCPGTTIGMSTIKENRLSCPIACLPGIHVGDCVPFYFCPRSVMLFVISRRNHPDLAYTGGQEPILHLVVDMAETVKWADAHGVRWAFTDSNAASSVAISYCDISRIPLLDWNAIQAKEWREVRSQKQCEFLYAGHFPWTLIEEIGVYSEQYREMTMRLLELSGTHHNPAVAVRRDWYY